MKKLPSNFRLALLASVVLAMLAGVHYACAQTTAFTYQGRLLDNGGPANGEYDLQCSLFYTNSGGSPVAGPLTNAPVAVSNGLFTVALDFGAGAFPGAARWLEIGVRTNGSIAAYTLLTPRQQVTATPYAIQAANAATAANFGGPLTDSQLSANIPRLDANQTFTGSNVFSATSGPPFVVGNSNLVTNLNADLLDGLDATAFVHKSGDTMTGALNLPVNGLVAGASQLVLSSGNVGLGSTNPLARLEIQGGADSGGANNPKGLALAHWERGGFRHWIRSRHNGAATGNYIDFYLNTNSSAGGSSAPGVGNAHVMTLANEGVGIGKTNPATALDVNGTVTAASFAGSGAGLTSLNASSLASGTVSGARLSGTYSNAVTFNNAGNLFSGSFGGFGANLQSLNASQLTFGTVPAAALGNAWQRGGNSGTTPGTDFVGTTDNQALELKVNNARALRLEPNTNGAPNVIGGASVNQVSSGVVGATVAGGGATNYGGQVFSNRVTSDFATVGGGRLNVGSASDSTVGGGVANTIQSGANASTIGGGLGNTIQYSASVASISGGYNNTIQAGASYATIPGGLLNSAGGSYSFAAGRQAKANHQGTFVWADSTAADFASSGSNQFLIRASGGVGIGKPNPATALDVNGIVTASAFSGSLAASQLTGTISSNNIGAGSITTVMLAAGAVGSNQLAAGAVTTGTLADGAVTASKIATVTNWFFLSTFTNPTPAGGDQFAWKVAAVGSDRVLIGAPYDDTGAEDAGAAHLFSSDGTLLTTFTNPTPAFGDQFGWSVAAVGSDRVLIAAYADDTGALDAGAAYLFSTNGALLTTFTNPTPEESDSFGWSVAAVGSDRVLIGAPNDDTGAADAGAAYLFGTNGMLLTTFTSPGPGYRDAFGVSVAAVGSDRVLIGALYANVGATDAGAAYLFSTNGTLLTTFTNPTPAAGDLFGWSVATGGSDRVLIGAPHDDTGATDAGAAYLFSTNGALLTTFTNPTPAAGENFGYSVAAVESDRVLIGSLWDDAGATDAGAAYLFSTEGTLLTTFTNPTPAANDWFGVSVGAVGSGRLLIGANYDDTGATDAGAAYLFSTQSYTPGLVAEAVRAGSVTTASLADGAVTTAKISGVLLPSQIPSLDASRITSGTIADARLSSNVALRDANQTFTGANTFNSPANSFSGTFMGNGAGLTNIGTASINPGSVTLSKLAPRAVGTNVPVGGLAMSESSGSYTSTADGVDVTNLVVTLVTSGRPVMLSLIADGSANDSYMGTYSGSSSSTSSTFAFVRNSTIIARHFLRVSIGGASASRFYDPPSAFSHIDLAPAGTNTYNLRVVTSSSTAYVQYVKLVAYEF